MIDNPGTGALTVRPHRSPRRGDVLRIALSGGLNYEPRGKSTWKLYWRIRL